MSERQPTLDVEALKRVEVIYRNRLEDEPGDMVARVSLAWCLFMRAFFQAGRESAVAVLTPQGKTADPQITHTVESVLDSNARQLLRECLRQTVTVMQLSPNPQDHLYVEKLQSLVRLSGHEDVVSEANDDAMRILTEITHEMLMDRFTTEKRPRRFPRQPPTA